MTSPSPDSPKSQENVHDPKRDIEPLPSSVPIANTIEPDNEDPAYDSEDGYATDDMTTGSRSISSSILGHTYEDGIRYHKFHDGQYAFPNDENEQNRDDMKHAMTVILCGNRLHFAPIGNNVQRIIDLGTGTGIWAIETADTYPSAEVIGIDLSPIQPNWVPPNVRFVVDDIEDEWIYPMNHFDYIHIRHTMHSIRNPVKLMERMLQHTKPGGWVEFQELHYYPQCDDETMDGTYAFRQFLELVRDGVANLGSDLNGVVKLRDLMINTGFTNVREDKLKLPIGIWARDKNLKVAGLFWRTAILDGLMSVAKRPLEKGLGWTTAEIEVLLVDVRKSLMNSSVHSYVPLHMLYAQKPMGAPESGKHAFNS